MPKSVLITGTSSGIGRAAALLFQRKGWNVAATMRSLENAAEFAAFPNVLVLPLDVTRPETIGSAVKRTIETFGRIDVLVNNAGIGGAGPFEAEPAEGIRRRFETNVFGLFDVTRAVLPHFRANGLGVLVNVTSMGGRLTTPLCSIHHATKWAVDGFSESLQFELRPLKIRVKIVEPGAIKWEAPGRSAEGSAGLVIPESLAAYREFTATARPRLDAFVAAGSEPEAVARAIFRAATDGSWRLRYPVGRDARTLLALRRFLPDSFYAALMRALVLRRPEA